MKNIVRLLRCNAMKFLSGVLIVSIFHMGCGSSYMVSSSPNAERSFPTFIAGATDQSATIVFQDGRTLHAHRVVAQPDSTSFLNVATGARTVVSTPEIEKIVFTDRGQGFSEGLLIGLLAGAGSGLLLAVTSDKSLIGNYIILPLVLGGLGLLLGMTIGGIFGKTDEYKFVNEPKKP